MNPDASRTCIYMAGTVAEAARVEATLVGGGIEYTVEIEPYVWHILGIFPSEHRGAAFYVDVEAAGPARERLRDAGLAPGIVEDAAPGPGSVS